MSNCNKRQYHYAYYAIKHLRWIRRHLQPKQKAPIRPYFCNICQKWHLTSKTKEEYEEAKLKKY